MRIKVTVQGGVVQDIETSQPAIVQIVDMDGLAANEVSTFETIAQDVVFDTDPDEPQLTDPSTPAP